jgi:hypothetical protein
MLPGHIFGCGGDLRGALLCGAGIPESFLTLIAQGVGQPGDLPEFLIAPDGICLCQIHHQLHILPGCHVISQRDYAVIIGSTEMLSKVGAIAGLFPSKCRVRIGVSLPFSDIDSLKDHYQEAVDAFEIGVMLDPDIRIYTFEDYGIYVMFRTVSDNEDLSRYLHPALPKLAVYDRENGTNLELTLHTYLKCACNTTETAEALYLHRNSVIYRLHRVEDLCDIDLGDTDTRFRLRLSFAISNVINQKRKWAGKDFNLPQ